MYICTRFLKTPIQKVLFLGHPLFIGTFPFKAESSNSQNHKSYQYILAMCHSLTQNLQYEFITCSVPKFGQCDFIFCTYCSNKDISTDPSRESAVIVPITHRLKLKYFFLIKKWKKCSLYPGTTSPRNVQESSKNFGLTLTCLMLPWPQKMMAN